MKRPFGGTIHFEHATSTMTFDPLTRKKSQFCIFECELQWKNNEHNWEIQMHGTVATLNVKITLNVIFFYIKV